MKMNKIHLILLLPAWVIFYFTYGAVHFQGLSSDHAIHILMADGFSFPHDLYYWGQDRLGSIIPIVGWFFYQFGVLTNCGCYYRAN